MKRLLFLLFLIASLFGCENSKERNKNERKELQDTIVENEIKKEFKKPTKPVFLNSKIDTTFLFGIWVENRENPHADFQISKDEFYIVDYDGDGIFPYLIDDNEIEIFYNGFSQQGLIYSVSKDSLTIMWNDNEIETKYVRFNNGYDYSEAEIIETIELYINNFKKNKLDKDYEKNIINPKLIVLDEIIYNEFNNELFEKLCQLIIETNQNERTYSTDILSKTYTRYQDKVYDIVYNNYKNEKLINILEYSYFDDNIYSKEKEVFILNLPDVEKLKLQYKESYYMLDLVYLFLRNNYKISSKKREIVKNTYHTDKRICSFKQEFNSIKYYLNRCSEGVSVESISIPKIDLELARKWIELIYKVTDSENSIKNKWNPSKMTFEPIDGGAGCYYIIKELNNRIEIQIKCGC